MILGLFATSSALVDLPGPAATPSKAAGPPSTPGRAEHEPQTPGKADAPPPGRTPGRALGKPMLDPEVIEAAARALKAAPTARSALLSSLPACRALVIP